MRTVVEDASRLRRFLAVVAALSIVGVLLGVEASRLLYGGVTTEELAAASIKGCEGQNGVRTTLRLRIMGDVVGKLEEIAQSVTLDPSLFPDIPPDRYAQELSEGVRLDGNRIEFFTSQMGTPERSASGTWPADCVARYSGD